MTWKSLDELDAGVCDGMTYEEIAESFPEDYAARDDDKFNYRYRGGESYRDVVIRCGCLSRSYSFLGGAC